MTDRYVSAGFFFNPEEGRVLLHLRSGDAEVDPSMWSLFGGRSEEMDQGDPTTTWQREVQEELGVLLERSQIQALPGFEPFPGPVGPRHVFFAEWTDASHQFVLTEGTALAWFEIHEALSLANLSDTATAAIAHFRNSRRHGEG